MSSKTETPEKWAACIIGDFISLASEHRAAPYERLRSDITSELASLRRERDALREELEKIANGPRDRTMTSYDIICEMRESARAALNHEKNP